MTIVLIAGGGIGGLSAAIALARQGYEAHVLEQADDFGEVGAGIQLSPNSVRVLHYLGLERQLAAHSSRPETIEIRDWKDGRLITRMPLGDEIWSRFGFPYYHIHRADLLNILIDDARASDNVHLHTGIRVENHAEEENGVVVRSAGREFRGNLLVGADGIHSTVRSQLFGASSPRYTGNVAWRALVPSSALPPGLSSPGATLWLGPRRHFIHYPIRHGEFVNCVCVVEKQERALESWTQRAGRDDLPTWFGHWHEPVKSLIEHIDSSNGFKWGLFDRPPMKAWARGRVVLLGDACHPTLPFMAQGAAMAIEDAVVLAACVSKSPNHQEAFFRYQQLRKPRTDFIQRLSRRNGRIFHLSGPLARARNLGAEWGQQRIMDKLYAYDPMAAAR